jgi:hypothetical protein
VPPLPFSIAIISPLKKISTIKEVVILRTEAQKRADRKYYLENKERKQKQSERASARRYINKCDIDELTEIKVWLNDRVNELKD